MKLETKRAFRRELLEQFARVGKALSSGARLELLELLSQTERTAEQLADETGLSFANVSQHMQALRRARMAEVRRDGHTQEDNMNMNQSESAKLNIRRLLVAGTAAALVGLAATSCSQRTAAATDGQSAAAGADQVPEPPAASTASKSNQSEQLPVLPSDPWQVDQLIKPEELIKSLSETAGEKPLVLQVGVLVLYHGGHIVGSKFAGPASKPQGVQLLKSEAENLPRDKPVVLYCGCCPWTNCPNIRPAFRTMQELGFKNVKVLEIPKNLRQDWIAKGFPIKKGDDVK